MVAPLVICEVSVIRDKLLLHYAPDALKIPRQYHEENRQNGQQKITDRGNSLSAKGIRREQKKGDF
jgi:hypothetical protein